MSHRTFQAIPGLELIVGDTVVPVTISTDGVDVIVYETSGNARELDPRDQPTVYAAARAFLGIK